MNRRAPDKNHDTGVPYPPKTGRTVPEPTQQIPAFQLARIRAGSP